MITLNCHEGMKLKNPTRVQTVKTVVLDFHVCANIPPVRFCPKSLIQRGSAPSAEI